MSSQPSSNNPAGSPDITLEEVRSMEEESGAFITWLDNLYTIGETNSADLTYKLGLNQFSDMNAEEFKLYVHGADGACFKGSDSAFVANRGRQDIVIEDVEAAFEAQPVQAPASVDW